MQNKPETIFSVQLGDQHKNTKTIYDPNEYIAQNKKRYWEIAHKSH